MPLGIRLVAALALVASGLVLQSRAPAVAAGCSGSTGVTVVVDHHQLGGGVQQACDADGGGKAASTVFPDSGFALTYVQRQPGFVCRVAGAPASRPLREHPAGRRVLVAVVVRREVRDLDLLQHRRRLAEGPRRGLCRVLLAGPGRQGGTGRHPDAACRPHVSVTVAERRGLERR